MDVKSAFLYGKIDEEIYVCQPLGFEDPEFPNKVYKVEKALYGLHQALRAWSKNLMHKKFQMSSMGELTFFLGLQVNQQEDGIFIHQDKYVDEILKKFGFSNMKTTTIPMDTSKPLLKDAEAANVDVHLYRSMIGSLMYLTSSRPDIMFVVCACARFQDSPFDLEAYTDSDYAGASLDRKSTIEDCQFLGRRLVSWQCKKQTIVANSTTEVEYAATANCCGHVKHWLRRGQTATGKELSNPLMAGSLPKTIMPIQLVKLQNFNLRLSKVLVNAARHLLILLGQVNTVSLNFVLMQVNAVRQKLTTASTS
ncbi:putative ribonuclease H-like domain-containing protein [Tanacetum coccineum]